MGENDVLNHVEAIFSLLDSMPRLSTLANSAPVLVVPYVFEPKFCRRLIDYYEGKGGEDSGFMVEVNGKTVGKLDYGHKRRMDCEITDQELVRATQERIKRRIVPAIRQAYQFDATRIERHIVACYDAAQGAHFRAHRDNTTLGTAHRRFAITINLNSPDYEGGEIWFPEFGPKKYKANSGDAIVFSCSLLHEVPKVTRGKRYAFLPFLYDDAAAAVRERNRKHLGDLSAAIGRPATNVCDSNASNSSFSKVVIDGSAGCGNPEGCQTCLTAPVYQLGKTGSDGSN
jgi:predicted 2-oxoglutarate/Fe(II)-dependent dioxygenase YbiX